MRPVLLIFNAFLFSRSFGLGSSNDLPERRKTFALLIAGSRGWHNYAHQANVCHAYQIFRSNGISRENIITMMYDDIAYNPKNPNPGYIFNSLEGPDVYKDIAIDYKGESITPENIIGVLTGNRSAVRHGTRRVMKRIYGANLLVYFSGHGSPRSLYIIEHHLYADDIIDVIQRMYLDGMYSRLLFIIDSSKSASICNGLLPEYVHAITATSPTERTFGYYCSYDRINDFCLSTEFSTRWMRDVEQHNLTNRTLEMHYQTVKEQTKHSKVSRFGSYSMSFCFLDQFFGWKSSNSPK